MVVTLLMMVFYTNLFTILIFRMCFIKVPILKLDLVVFLQEFIYSNRTHGEVQSKNKYEKGTVIKINKINTYPYITTYTLCTRERNASNIKFLMLCRWNRVFVKHNKNEKFFQIYCH